MKKIYLSSLLLGLLAINTACEDIDESAIFQADFQKILMLKTNGIVDLTIYKTGENSTYELSIMKNGTSPEKTAEAVICPMNKEELKVYNETRGLSLEALPENCYELAGQDMFFNANERYKKVNLTLHTNNIDELADTEKDYVIPLILKSETDSVSSAQNILIVRPNVIIPSVTFTKKGLQAQYCGKGTTTLTIPLELQIENKWDFTCTVEVDETKAGNHPLLQNGYTLENNGVVTFSKGNKTANLTVTVNRTETTELDMNTYVLPLVLQSISLETFQKDNDAYLLGVNSKFPLEASMLSTNAQEPSEGPLANVLDGKIGTFFHSAWSVAVEGKHYVQVNLPNTISSFMFSYTNRDSNGNAALAWFDVETSNDGQTFTPLKSYAWDADSLPGGGAEVFNSTKLESTSPFKSIRFICKQNFTGGAFFVWSEFSLYAL
ncbi:BT_3987 domain-containing protein [Bacteroides acidifaciens]|uniref:BT_3987 domain-containing protein n=1 Tax=Bacteroides acidifaciens TaxID=85831 RepID=UPI00046A5966|nr:DUF1735 domain-containing protein [Bacteroides acidifaciens]MCR1997397.1 DUF1735 domain-containing protein [Bacteroides acidifaciens]